MNATDELAKVGTAIAWLRQRLVDAHAERDGFVLTLYRRGTIISSEEMDQIAASDRRIGQFKALLFSHHQKADALSRLMLGPDPIARTRRVLGLAVVPDPEPRIMALDRPDPLRRVTTVEQSPLPLSLDDHVLASEADRIATSLSAWNYNCLSARRITRRYEGFTTRNATRHAS